MKKILKIILGIAFVLIVAAAIAWFGFLKPAPPPISPEDRSQIYLMPLPSELTLNKGHFIIDSDLGHIFKEISTPRLERAVNRFYSRLESQTGILFRGSDAKKLFLKCKNRGGKYPSVNDNETYDLSVTNNKITLSANSETGILYGLESLLQLVKQKEGKWIVPILELNDQPRYPWRGLMIDVGRHWIPKEVILRNLDAMAALKMNVLHLHLTEYQGFRIESKVFPKLHEMGSNGNYFTQVDIKELIDYAADRGIRVIPEFDLPGHATSWLVGYPELASAPGPYKLETKLAGLADPVMNPTKEVVYEFLDQFIGEMTALFPDEYLHIGGDEVQPRHWKENVEIQKFMKEKEISDYHELQAYFNIRLQKILKKYGKEMMGWDEIIHPDLPKDNIAVQSWRNQKSLWEAARNGNKALLSAGYYLDHKQSAEFHYKVDPLIIPSAVTIDIDSTNWKGWKCKMFVQDMEIESSLFLFGEEENLRGIISFMENFSDFTNVILNEGSLLFNHESQFGNIKYNLNIKGDSIKGQAKISLFTIDIKGKRTGGSDMVSGTPLPRFEKIEPLTFEQQANILGGEACMWTEMVDKRTIDSRIWPRVAAVAEKLWSPKVLTLDNVDMYRRLIVLDELLNKMGLKHQESSEELILDMVEKQHINPLRTLISVLQEDKLFNRMQIYDPELYTTTPLNRVVDAARPESYVAYSFNKDIDLWIETKNEDAESRIIQSLEIWSKNHDELSLAFKNVERLKEVELHSKHLSELSKLGLEAINNPESLKKRILEIDTLLEKGGISYGGTTLPIVDGMRKLLGKVK